MKNNLKRQNNLRSSGFSLIEALIAIGIFVIMVVPIYISYSNIINALQKNQAKSYALSLIQNGIETVRNMPYDQVGIQGGFPPGQIPASQTIAYQGYTYNLQYFVRNIDDPFDGLAPTDTTPADYKLIQITALCTSCLNALPITITTTDAPKSLESATTNGSLFVNVFDANGNPLSLVNVQVVNNALIPPISITDTTGLNGMLQLVGIPTSTASYQIFVSKPGYSSDQTYPAGAPGNPNPVKPNATVAQGQVTQISFAIDKVSTLNIQTANNLCAAIPNIPFSLSGSKLIGTNPNILKYTSTTGTGTNGSIVLNNIEWDTYSFAVGGGQYDLSGNSPSLPLTVNPSSTYQLNWLITPRVTSSILITVKDASSTLINNASVQISNGTFNQTAYTGRRLLTKSDWSNSNYSSQSGNIDASTPGSLSLLFTNGQYPTSTPNWLISNTIDFGTASTTFYNLNWQPTSEPPQTGANSLKFQVAANNDNATWSFTGPDGTANTYYATSSASLNSVLSGNRYLRYKVYLQTQNSSVTPTLNSITINFSSSCVPNGQAFLNGIPAGSYTITVTAAGYQVYTDSTLTIGNGWQSYNAIISP